MPRIKPYQGTSQTRLSQLIRKAQTPALPTSVNFDFGTPSAGPDPVAGSTTVAAEAYSTGRRDNPKDVNYTRLSLDALSRLPEGELVPFDPMTFPTTVHAILPQINAGLGLNLVATEVVDDTLTSIPVNGLTLTVTSASLAWLPGEYFFPYAPNSQQPAARNVDGNIPTDERRRIRVLEQPVA